MMRSIRRSQIMLMLIQGRAKSRMTKVNQTLNKRRKKRIEVI